MDNCNYWEKLKGEPIRFHVECRESGKWVGKMCCNYECESFYSIANCEDREYRILENGKDVTSRYKDKKYIDNNTDDSIKTSKIMKPSEYKQLDKVSREKLFNQSTKLKCEGMRRSEIFQTLHISEATYDEMRKEFAVVKKPGLLGGVR